MTTQEAIETLTDLLDSEMATRRPSQGGLKPAEKQAIRLAVRLLTKIEMQLPVPRVGSRKERADA